MKRFLFVSGFIFLVLAFVMCVPTKPKLVLDKDALAFSNNPDGADVFQLTFTIKTQDSTEAIPWAIDDSQVSSWLSFSSKSGTATPLPETITVTVKEPVPTENKNGIITISSSMEGIDNVTITATFTHITEKEDVYASLVWTADGSNVYYGYVTPDNQLTILTIPSDADGADAYDIEYEYDFGTETGDIYVVGFKYDMVYDPDYETDMPANYRVCVWKNNVPQANIPAPANMLIDSVNKGYDILTNNQAGVVNGITHIVVSTKISTTPVPEYSSTQGWSYQYWNGTQYLALPLPTPIGGSSYYKLQGLKSINGKIYIYGYQRAGVDWVSNELRPIVWINDNGSITVVESFPTFDSVAGILPGGQYREVDMEDIIVKDNNDIIIVGRLSQGTGSGTGHYYYTGLYNSNGNYTPVGPNNGITNDTISRIVKSIASENDYIISVGSNYYPDFVYLNGTIATLPNPSLFDPNKNVDYIVMMSDGEDIYIFGDHEHYIDGINPPLLQKTVIYRNTKLIQEFNTLTEGSDTYESMSALDFDAPKRPSSK